MTRGTRTLDWSALVVAVVGGDEREQEISRLAAATGATVRGYGFPWPEEEIEGVHRVPDAAAALNGAHVALFPIPGLGDDGALFAPAAVDPIVPSAELLRVMAPGALILLGTSDDRLELAADEVGATLIEYEDDQELMLLRGPAVVEGALRLAIEATRITIHEARVAVVGYGSISSLLALTLSRLGADVTVVARNPVQRAHARAVGLAARPLDELAEVASEVTMLFSAVPAPVVGADVLRRLPPGSLVMDLAAPPGSIDLDSARSLGHRALWARGMGRRAPVTVGRSQWTGIEERIERFYS